MCTHKHQYTVPYLTVRDFIRIPRPITIIFRKIVSSVLIYFQVTGFGACSLSFHVFALVCLLILRYHKVSEWVGKAYRTVEMRLIANEFRRNTQRAHTHIHTVTVGARGECFSFAAALCAYNGNKFAVPSLMNFSNFYFILGSPFFNESARAYRGSSIEIVGCSSGNRRWHSSNLCCTMDLWYLSTLITFRFWQVIENYS